MSGTDSDSEIFQYTRKSKYEYKEKSYRFRMNDNAMSHRKLNPLTVGHELKRDTDRSLERRHDEYPNDDLMLKSEVNTNTDDEKWTVGHVKKKDTDAELDHRNAEYAKGDPRLIPELTTKKRDIFYEKRTVKHFQKKDIGYELGHQDYEYVNDEPLLRPEVTDKAGDYDYERNDKGK